ncbi:MAG: hypothetical protein ACLGXA_01520 [Acidobacteriota bacterium]
MKPWVLSLSGLLAAIGVALWARPPMMGLSFGKAVATSALWVGVAVLAGTLGLVAYASFAEGRIAYPPVRLMVGAGATWVLIPAMLLCWFRGSGWAAVMSAGAGAAMAACLWGLAAAEPVDEREPWAAGPHFADLPAPDSRRPQAFAIAVCVELAIVLVSRGAVFLATALMGIAGFLFVWKRLASFEAKVRDGLGRPTVRVSGATVVALMILVPLLMARFVRMKGSVETQAQAAARTRGGAEKGTAADAYQGIVLFTVQDRKKELPPLPMQRDLLHAGMAKPLVIPFDGSYWYFQAPEHGPGAHPHLAHGDPVAVSIYSTGWVPLAMQAHQTLAQAVDLRSCGAVRVTLRNGDNRDGRIDMGMLLTDSMAPGKPSMYLGRQPIVSTEPEHFAIKVNPVTDAATFAIPERRTIRKFDEVTVFFFPDAMHATQGARVGIEQFEVMPR